MRESIVTTKSSEEDLWSHEDIEGGNSEANNDPLIRILPPNSRIITENISECRDTHGMQKDNVVIQATASGIPCDRGAKDIWAQIDVPRPLTLHRVAITKFRNKRCFVLPIKRTNEDCISYEDWYSCLCASHNVTVELQCTSFSIAKIQDSNEICLEIENLMIKAFNNLNITITICSYCYEFLDQDRRTR